MSFDDIGYGILAQAHLAPDRAVAASDRDERHHLGRETVGFRPLPGLTGAASTINNTKNILLTNYTHWNV